MTIIRADEFYKFHTISIEDVLKHGMEKACILGNITNVSTKFENIHEGFPYFEKEKFYKLLNELKEEGLLSEVKRDK